MRVDLYNLKNGWVINKIHFFLLMPILNIILLLLYCLYIILLYFEHTWYIVIHFSAHKSELY